MLSSFIRSVIRIFAFVRKELVEILRQTRLVVTLILAPFLILLLFGVGYREQPSPLRTVVVVPPDSVLRPLIDEYSQRFQQQIVLEGVTNDEEEAEALLRRKAIDLVIVLPADPLANITANQQSTLELRHFEIDPYQQSFVRVLAQAMTQSINDRFLEAVAEEGKAEASSLQTYTELAQENASAMRDALAQGDVREAQRHRQSLQNNVRLLTAALGTSVAMVSGMQEAADPGGDSTAGEILSTLDEIQSQLTDLEPAPGEAAETVTPAQTEAAAETETDLERLNDLLRDFRRIDSYVLVSPFRYEVHNISSIELDAMHFFVPAVIALLLQHIAVTFAALSIVREEREGAIELFRAAPVSALEMLLGKYLSYIILAAGLTAILTLLVVYLLGMPMLGQWLDYVIVISVFLLATLGLGFNFSLSAQTDSQAVQYAMSILLASIFFSGFILALDRLWLPVRVVSWAIPATYAIELLQNIMLRGQELNLYLLIILGAISLVLFFSAWIRLGRRLARA